jgi:hypothetical protein
MHNAFHSFFCLLQTGAADSLNLAPLLPGSDLLGMGIDLKQGISLKSNTRSWVIPANDVSIRDQLVPFVVDDTTTYMVPPYVAVQRNFDASIEMKVFQNAAQQALNIAASVALEVTVMGIGGSAELSFRYSTDSTSKVVFTSNELNVQLYELVASRLTLADVDPQMLVRPASIQLNHLSWLFCPLLSVVIMFVLLAFCRSLCFLC